MVIGPPAWSISTQAVFYYVPVAELVYAAAKNLRRTKIHVSSSLTRDTYAGVTERNTYLSQSQVFEGSKSPFHSGPR